MGIELLSTGRCYLKNEGVQSHSVDFWHRIRCEGIVVRLSVQSVTHSWTCTTGAPFPLLRARSADPELLQTLHLGLRIKTHFLYLSCEKNKKQNNPFMWSEPRMDLLVAPAKLIPS